jgi:hypothetical protein
MFKVLPIIFVPIITLMYLFRFFDSFLVNLESTDVVEIGLEFAIVAEMFQLSFWNVESIEI